jgi:hypothetical protein
MITAEEIYRALEAKNAAKPDFNRWIGASMIGHGCPRYVALSFRCAFANPLKGQTLRIFENGNKAEDRIVADIEATGRAKVISRQMQLDMPGGLGHAGVTLDGVVELDGKRYLVLEIKTMNAKGWKELSAKGVKEAKRQHWAQMQFGMLCTKLPEALYAAENKDTNELYLEIVPYDEPAAQGLAALATAVLEGKEPARCNENPTWYECKWCQAFGICKGSDFPRAHCLTCCHSTPVAGGKWTCARWDNAEIPKENLPQGCAEHIYLPWLVNLPVVGWGEYWVSYRLPDGRRLVNCAEGSFPTIDGGEAPAAVLDSKRIEEYGNLPALLAKCGETDDKEAAGL